MEGVDSNNLWHKRKVNRDMLAECNLKSHSSPLSERATQERERVKRKREREGGERGRQRLINSDSSVAFHAPTAAS